MDKREGIKTGVRGMSLRRENEMCEKMKKIYPEKFVSEQEIFRRIHRGDRIFISTACGEPQYLVRALIQFVESNPKAFFDAEVIHVWSLGVAPYTEEKFKSNFRHNSFFIGNNSREAVNRGMADYTPIFLSRVPELLSRGLVPIQIALIQTSPPDEHGYMSLGVSVDIVKGRRGEREGGHRPGEFAHAPGPWGRVHSYQGCGLHPLP